LKEKTQIEILALVNRLKLRDESAMGEVYDRFASAMYGVASKIVRSDEIAQDVVQDSFVKIWKKVES
jgi:RNA polymerase sigma-70 factor (ECF subfamily)